MKTLLIILIVLSFQTVKVVKKDGDFPCKITAATDKDIDLECSDTTYLVIPRSEWPPAWGEIPTVWNEQHLVGQVHYARRVDGRLSAVTHESKLHPCAITECVNGEKHSANKCRCDGDLRGLPKE